MYVKSVVVKTLKENIKRGYKMEKFMFVLPEELKDKVKEHAEKNYMSMAAVVKKSLVEYFDRVDNPVIRLNKER